MDKKIKKWVNVPVSDVINMRTGSVEDLLDGTMLRLDSITGGRVRAFMDGDIETLPDLEFFADVRDAIAALGKLRQKMHFQKV